MRTAGAPVTFAYGVNSRVLLGALLAAGLLLPPVLHLLPSFGGVPTGARLIPLFYAPLVAAVFFSLPVALMVALFPPIFNFLAFGRPTLFSASVLTFELAVYVTALQLLTRRVPALCWWLGLSAYAAAKTLSVLLLLILGALSIYKGVEPVSFLRASVGNAWPGLIVLLCLGLMLERGADGRSA